MTQANTTENGFNTASQAGSKRTWSSLSSMVYPTEGTGTCELTAAQQGSNFLYLQVPYEASNIPNGSQFVEMRLTVSTKKSGSFSSSTNLTWYAGTNLASRRSTWTDTVDNTYAGHSPDGDRTYWGLSAYSVTEIIERIKAGTLYFKLEAATTSAVACTANITGATVRITYNTIEGKRGALIAAMI